MIAPGGRHCPIRRFPLLLALLASGCREGPAPFSIENPVPDASGQLTFSVKEDRVPAWSQSSDSIYYVAESYPGLPPSPGVLATVPRAGGVARAILPAVQVGFASAPWLTAPAFSNDGSSIAFFQLTQVATETSCVAITCPYDSLNNPTDTAGTSSALVQAVLRIRKVASTSIPDDARLTVQFEGRPSDWQMLTFMPNVAYPFQKAYERHGLPVFRASWAPDGTRLVFSDGLRLRIWTIGQDSAVMIPGTDDGVLPAWSPDGSWIAFTRLVRGPVQRIVCFCIATGANPSPRYDRTIYSGGSREDGQLMLVRPDGSDLTPLGLGEAPSWSPDGKTIVAHRDHMLFRIAVETGAATEIPNTVNGFEPAISRDGHWLAFVRIDEPALNPDIWVVPF